MPEQVLRVLEALKLFLNMPGCVYVLGIDRLALENSIRHRYQGSEVNEADYLDKIVQLPFAIPPIATGAMTDFVSDLLPGDLQGVTGDLVESLEENPRQVKRFVNSFLLNHELAHQMLNRKYEPSRLAAVLLFQYRKPDLFKQALRDPGVFARLAEGSDEDETTERWIQRLGKRLADVPAEELAPYIYLSEVAGVRDLRFDVVLTKISGQRVPLIKVIREYTGLGLKESKGLLELPPPTAVHNATTREEAERMIAALVEAGAEAEVY